MSLLPQEFDPIVQSSIKRLKQGREGSDTILHITDFRPSQVLEDSTMSRQEALKPQLLELQQDFN